MTIGQHDCAGRCKQVENNKHCYYNQAMQDNVAFLAGDIGRLFRKRFESSGPDETMTGPQMRLLGAISRNPGASQIALANLLDVEPITAARMLDRLQQAGLVERRPDPADRRAWRLHLTPQAEPLLNSARDRIATMVDDALEDFSDAERSTLEVLLKRLRDNLSTEPQIGAPRTFASELKEVAVNG